MTFPKQLKQCFCKAVSYLVPLFFILSLLNISPNISAQNNKIQDVLLLENGDKIKGHIIQHTEETLKIRLPEGSEITYKFQEIKEITQEKTTNPIFVKIKEKGYFNTSTIGLQIISDNNNSLFSLHSVNGYYFRSYFAIGAGIGIDNYNDSYPNRSENSLYDYPEKFYTAFLSMSGDLTKRKKITPTYSIEHGYGFPFIKNYETDKGGLYFNYGLGLKLRSKDTFDWIFSINYQNQTDYITTNRFVGSRIRTTSGIVLRTGFSF